MKTKWIKSRCKQSFLEDSSERTRGEQTFLVFNTVAKDPWSQWQQKVSLLLGKTTVWSFPLFSDTELQFCIHSLYSWNNPCATFVKHCTYTSICRVKCRGTATKASKILHQIHLHLGLGLLPCCQPRLCSPSPSLTCCHTTVLVNRLIMCSEELSYAQILPQEAGKSTPKHKVTGHVVNEFLFH